MRRYRMPRRYRGPRTQRPTMGRDCVKFFVVLTVLVAVPIAGFLAYLDIDANATEAAAAKRQAEDEHAAWATLSRPCMAARPLFAAQPASEGGVEPKRVSHFDVMGVRLYQPPRIILNEVATAGFFITSPDLELASCASDMIAADQIARRLDPGQEAPDAKSSCIGSLTFTNHQTTLTVDFTEDYPKQPGCVVASSIDLQEPGGDNDASHSAWDRAIIKKYGKPDPDGMWNENNDGPEMEDFSDAGDQFRELSLDDPAFVEAVKAATDQAVSDDRPFVAPQL
jgi:hypothetical protein